VVGARTGQAQTAPNRTQSQLLNQPQVDLEALGLTFELPTTGASDSPKLWGTMGSDMAMSPQPATSRVSQASHKPFLLHACPACSVTNCLHVEQRPLYANVQQNEIRLANRQCSVTWKNNCANRLIIRHTLYTTFKYKREVKLFCRCSSLNVSNFCAYVPQFSVRWYKRKLIRNYCRVLWRRRGQVITVPSRRYCRSCCPSDHRVYIIEIYTTRYLIGSVPQAVI
jgi:hypothetical protein